LAKCFTLLEAHRKARKIISALRIELLETISLLSFFVWAQFLLDCMDIDAALKKSILIRVGAG
jgi:hypothetical protein